MKGRIYTISGFQDGNNGVGILLEEGNLHGMWYAYNPARFRPVQDTKKSYEQLQALLNPANHKDPGHVHPNSPVPELV